MILVNVATKKIIPIPMHGKDLKRGLLRHIIKQAELTVAEFLNLL